MPGFTKIIARLKSEERKAVKELTAIRNAIASLEFGAGAGATAGPARGALKPGRRARGGRRRLSRATRRKMAAAQKARWARAKAAGKS